jgi:multidrug efflux system membrane fusion protein
MIQVVSGLAAGNQVVIDGADKLREGSKIVLRTETGTTTPAPAKGAPPPAAQPNAPPDQPQQGTQPKQPGQATDQPGQSTDQQGKQGQRRRRNNDQ